MEAKTYNTQGKVAGNITLPDRVFGVPWNADLVHQVTVSMQANARINIAHTKGSGDVRGGGKKPWQQKGTGRARHGSRRSPLWRGGGVSHGPRNEKDYSKTINKKMRTKALFIALSRKFKDGEIIFVEGFDFKAPKTAQATASLSALSGAGFAALSRKKHNAAVVALSERDENVFKSFRNISNVDTVEVRNLNPVVVLEHKYVVFSVPQKAVSILAEKAGETKAVKSVIAPAQAKKTRAVSKPRAKKA